MVHSSALARLEFDKMSTDMQTFVACSLGRERLHQLTPFASRDEAISELDAVDEAQRFLRRKGPLPYGGVTDVRLMARKAAVGGVLTALELSAIADFLHGGQQVKKAIESVPQRSDFERLSAAASCLREARAAATEIRAKISEEALVLDGASPALRRLRQERRTVEGRIRGILEEGLKRYAKSLQDPVIALRGDHLCLPVRADAKGQVPGAVHDVSASGATVFVEPAAAVEAGGRARQLLLEEEREIERILQALSAVVAAIAADIEQNAHWLGELDAWFAKAAHATARGWTRPLLCADGVWRLRQAWHPLIRREEAVPLDLTLGDGATMLLITGPNTGGKTVTLKTLGLLTLLGMAGAYVPAMAGTAIGWCDGGVFVDIGDEQSIEQSLSTFSSHLRNVVPIFREVTEHSLVLLDELGAGTDPAEGAALAVAILEELNSRHCRVAVTTHYPELKAYAFREKNAINASVEFDVETLRPTYRLLVGVPGRSNAIAIADRLGMPASVLRRARSHVSGENLRIENLIDEMNEARWREQTARQAADKAQMEAQRLADEWRQRLQALERSEDERQQRAQAEARRTVEQAMAEADRIIAELRRMQRQGAGKDHELVALRKALEAQLPASGPGQRQRGATAAMATVAALRKGALVRVLSLGQKGEVVERDEKSVVVQLGALRMKVDTTDVEPIGGPVTAPVTPTVRRAVTTAVGMQLDVRGETVDDAIFHVDRYVDDAILSGFERVTIIHGKGTGALRQGLRQYLSNHAQIRSWSTGGAREGGDGVTVIELNR